MNRQGFYDGYQAMVPVGAEWPNRCTARSVIRIMTFRPARVASQVSCPALMIVSERDRVVRSNMTIKAVSRMPDAKLIRWPADHFDIYHGSAFDSLVQQQVQFLQQIFQSAMEPLRMSAAA